MSSLPRPLTVSIDPVSDSPYVSQIYAGVYDLEALGEIDVEYARRPQVRIEERDHEFHIPTNRHVFYLEIRTQDCKAITVCLDMHDSPRAASWNGLVECDFYFKRSYYRPFLEQYLAERGEEYVPLLNKIIPYGLNYRVTSANERHHILRKIVSLSNQRMWLKDSKYSIRQLAQGVARSFSWETHVLKASRRLEVDYTYPAERSVLLQTRLIDPGIAKSEQGADLINQLNERRVDIVRALKAGLGDRFVGGIIPQGSVAKQYPREIMTNEAYGGLDYLDLLSRNTVVVYTKGRAHSNGWRLPEYLSMSRCIVSEQLHYELPVPLQEGKNVLYFDTPESCVHACQRLLADDTMADKMRENNWNYYLNNVQPAAIVRNCLLKALALKQQISDA